MASRSRIDVFLSMSSAVAQFLAGVHVALVVASVVEVTPRAHPLVAQVVREGLEVLLPAPVDLEAAAVASTVVSVEEAEAVEALVVIEVSAVGVVVLEVSVVEAEAAVEATVVDEGVSDTSQTAMDLPMVLQLARAVPEAVVLVAIEEVEAVTEATVVVDDTTRDVGVTIEDPAVLTTNRLAAEIDTATVTVDMVEAETMVHGSARTMATATTIHEHDEDTKPDLRLGHYVQGFVKKVTSLFFAPAFLVNEGKIDSVQLLTFRLYSTAQYRRVRSAQHQNTPMHHRISRITSTTPGFVQHKISTSSFAAFKGITPTSFTSRSIHLALEHVTCRDRAIKIS
jgi:hypothetical protein